MVVKTILRKETRRFYVLKDDWLIGRAERATNERMRKGSNSNAG